MNHQPHLPPQATKSIHNPNPLSPSKSKTSSDCRNCGSPNRWVLHNVRLHSNNRRLCTSCVLRLHPSSFCPSCFQFYESRPPPSSSNSLTCFKCSSITHPHCVPAPPPPSSSDHPSSYLCPLCAKPNSSFDLDSNSIIDRKTALVLLCASKIASASMAKAVVVARAEAERRVKEAALARKRAREAIENVAFVVARERSKRKEEGSIEVSKDKETSRNMLGGCFEKVENSCEGSVVAGLQRKEIHNGGGGVVQNSTPKNGVAVPAQMKMEVDCIKSNGGANDKDKSADVIVGSQEIENNNDVVSSK